MKLMFNILPMLLLATTISLLFAKPRNITLEGWTVDATNDRPIEGVYVYTVSGEEEQLTDAKGRFKFKSWKGLPVSCTATHKDFKQAVIKIIDSSPITIKLSRK